MNIEKILQNACETTPQWHRVPSFDPDLPVFSGIQAIVYDGLETADGKTPTFAYLGFPEKTDSPVPAIVLVHGGGGQAYLSWVKMWTDRGYAAIAMNTRGYFPTGVNAGSRLPEDPGVQHGMFGDFLQPGYVDSPDEDGMSKSDLPLTERWITHALVKVIHAHNLLRSLPQVDRRRIGITGISWGGVITSLVITHDPRFAFAIPVYGSGYLDIAPTTIGDNLRLPGNNAHFRAEKWFDRVAMPVLWLAWNDDCPFCVTSNSRSYLDTAAANEKTMLSFLNNMGHSHPCGWAPPIIAAYADWIVQNGSPLVTFLTQPAGKDACAQLRVPADVTDLQATLYWLDAPITYSVHDKHHIGNPNLRYMDQIWQTEPAVLIGDQITAKLPEAACGYYLEVRYRRNGEELASTSVYTQI